MDTDFGKFVVGYNGCGEVTYIPEVMRNIPYSLYCIK